MDELSTFAHIIFPWLRRRADLRRRWAHPGDGYAWGARWYFDLARKRLGPAATVDDTTWSDLELPQFFLGIDTAITPVGRQYLFAWLRTYLFDRTAHDARYHAYTVLQSNHRLREQIQLNLAPLAVDASAFIADLLLGPPPEKIRWGSVLWIWSLVTVAGVVAAVLHLLPIWLAALPLVLNCIIAMRIDAHLAHNVNGLMALVRMLAVASKIARSTEEDTILVLQKLRQEAVKRRQLRSQIRWLATVEGFSAGLMGGIVVAANLFFLMKLSLYARFIDRFAGNRDEWLSTFEWVGELDASIAIASFLKRYPAHCRPAVTDNEIRLENGYHPLIAKPVCNSIALTDRSALITGSNMAGKTTFIKMVALNAVLGHTVGVCLADSAHLPRSPVRALIRGSQSVAEGKSRYFAEAEAIHEFMQEAAAGTCRVFFLDEPFSGTNTIERIAVARAVLGAIAATAQILVTSHDVELQRLLGNRFEFYYFQENPDVEGFFDHRLQVGTSHRRNAIRVLERLGYPAAIIAEALANVPSTQASMPTPGNETGA